MQQRLARWLALRMLGLLPQLLQINTWMVMLTPDFLPHGIPVKPPDAVGGMTRGVFRDVQTET